MNRRVIILYLISALALFGLAGQLHQPLLDARRTEGLNQTEPIENAPPLVAFTTVALGGFRGIIADTLWIRASRMQSEGRFFELVQLSDWITKLEPRFTTVWAFHAWNMSYNVSVMFPDPEDRWRWVRHGIALLTEEGLRYNPGAPDLYRELGWLYQHKISATQDNAHWYYKQKWSEEMNLLLPGGRLAYDTLAQAPMNEKEFARLPGAHALITHLKTAYGTALPRTAFQLQAMTDSAETHSAELADAYSATATRHLLKTVYRMTVASMHDLELHYGKQDWRKPQVHAVYWAVQGQTDSTDFSQIALQRMISQSFADLFLNGGAYIAKTSGASYLDVYPDALPAARKAFREARQTFPDVATFTSAYQNFLHRAMFEMWLQGDDETADALYDELESDLPEGTALMSQEQILCGTLFSLAGEGEQNMMSLRKAAFRQYELWASRGQLARAMRYQSIPLLCP